MATERQRKTPAERATETAETAGRQVRKFQAKAEDARNQAEQADTLVQQYQGRLAYALLNPDLPEDVKDRLAPLAGDPDADEEDEDDLPSEEEPIRETED